MASLFFDDYDFPTEMYDKETGDFSLPIRTLLDFTPHILSELPKKPEEQKRMSPDEKTTSWFSFMSSAKERQWPSWLSTDRAMAVGEYLLRYGTSYMEMDNERKRRTSYRDYEEEFPRKKRFRSYWTSSTTSPKQKREEEDSSDEEEDQSSKNKKAKQTTVQKQEGNATLYKSAAAVGALTLSLYSTYQANVAYGDITFHNQLEVLLTHVHSILKSTQIWIKQHEKLGDSVPEQLTNDMITIQELVQCLERLDPRSEKKSEATGWGIGALGGLSALGGIAFGSSVALTGGTAVALGGMLWTISSKARSSSKQIQGARLMLESQVRQLVNTCQKQATPRKRVIQNAFTPFVKSEPVDLRNQSSSTSYAPSEPRIKNETTRTATKPISKHSSKIRLPA
ncbi:uncharacterized protein BYT42DRAFT_589162 [Radiomyces spectabilis]|uniref:uncharacterized protein n=1 Tax=Radiomyces spectabilis TaxID=64574 RepID=UPI00222095EC|nr:uncharacterized protein BYT42DRAFT_589162 [Radiomyces spectabilis]KAI8365209.1 hypothetical protein BYT42DRAFT_589162 [Radiomyces spectabilis]